jgi:hypothetical protein
MLKTVRAQGCTVTEGRDKGLTGCKYENAEENLVGDFDDDVGD